MKLSIWPQFSSNHSSRFTVVGVFETPGQAQAAADELNRVFKEAWDWSQVPENAAALREGNAPSLTPPEQALAARYGVDWDRTAVFDWLRRYEYDDAVEVFGNFIFVIGTESHLAAHPIEVIVEKLGAAALVDGSLTCESGSSPIGAPEIFCVVTVVIICHAPDESSAQEIDDAVREFFHWKEAEGVLTDHHAPWHDPKYWPSLVDGSIERNGMRLVLMLRFFHIAEELPEVVEYLRSRGCTGLQYHFSEVRYY